jgi:hypothetical protein
LSLAKFRKTRETHKQRPAKQVAEPKVTPRQFRWVCRAKGEKA